MDILMVYWKATWQAAVAARHTLSKAHDGGELAAFDRRLHRPNPLAAALAPTTAAPGTVRFTLGRA